MSSPPHNPNPPQHQPLHINQHQHYHHQQPQQSQQPFPVHPQQHSQIHHHHQQRLPPPHHHQNKQQQHFTPPPHQVPTFSASGSSSHQQHEQMQNHHRVAAHTQAHTHPQHSQSAPGPVSPTTAPAYFSSASSPSSWNHHPSSSDRIPPYRSGPQSSTMKGSEHFANRGSDWRWVKGGSTDGVPGPEAFGRPVASALSGWPSSADELSNRHLNPVGHEAQFQVPRGRGILPDTVSVDAGGANRDIPSPGRYPYSYPPPASYSDELSTSRSNSTSGRHSHYPMELGDSAGTTMFDRSSGPNSFSGERLQLDHHASHWQHYNNSSVSGRPVVNRSYPQASNPACRVHSSSPMEQANRSQPFYGDGDPAIMVSPSGASKNYSIDRQDSTYQRRRGPWRPPPQVAHSGGPQQLYARHQSPPFLMPRQSAGLAKASSTLEFDVENGGYYPHKPPSSSAAAAGVFAPSGQTHVATAGVAGSSPTAQSSQQIRSRSSSAPLSSPVAAAPAAVGAVDSNQAGQSSSDGHLQSITAPIASVKTDEDRIGPKPGQIVEAGRRIDSASPTDVAVNSTSSGHASSPEKLSAGAVLLDDAAKDKDQMDSYIAELARRRDVEAILKRVKQIVNSVATMSTELRSSVPRNDELTRNVESIVNVMNELVESSLMLETNWEDWTALKDIDVIRRKRMRIAMDEPSEVRPPVRKRTSKKESDAGPGLCHGCHATETPEWRRGPSGSRTLCNACGLIYVKMKKLNYLRPGNSTGGSSVDDVGFATGSRPNKKRKTTPPTLISPKIHDSPPTSSSMVITAGRNRSPSALESPQRMDESGASGTDFRPEGFAHAVENELERE
ncbi:hypothetical protein DFJ73DRAFT_823347 [Zopfochytrium polystomum]|nr:hypothetical protein DFJ73DRAFT_823347 [Zopfochytrium polystomum]